MAAILPPHVFDAMIHKAFSSPVRKQILLAISEKPKYLSEIGQEVSKKPQTIDFHLKVLVELGLVEANWIEGKKYFSIRDKNIVKFLKDEKPMVSHFHHKPPHQIVEEAMRQMEKKLTRIEKKLDKLLEKQIHI
ncbi:MAG: winged helix-turn-helix domain-containing protein [Nanoarchaeota archaeon]|nr:winged helix-turn-helix domain-containing protein [Nanoarchaeota archaeon]